MAQITKPRFQLGHYPRSMAFFATPIVGSVSLFWVVVAISMLTQKAPQPGWKEYATGILFLIVNPFVAVSYLSSRLAIFDDRISICSFMISGRRFLETDIPLSALTNVYTDFDPLGTYSVMFEFSEKCRGFAKSYGKRQLHGFLTELSLLVDESVIEQETRKWMKKYDQQSRRERFGTRM